MSNDNSGRGRDPKRPSRTIDLKATEVRPSKSKEQPEPPKPVQQRTTTVPAAGSVPKGNTSGGAPTATAAALSAARTKPQPSAQPAASSGSQSSATSSSPPASGSGGRGSAGGTGSGSGGGGNGSGRPEPEKVIIRERRGSSFLGVLTHLAAGVVGGGIVLYGADTIQQIGREAGIDIPQPTISVPQDFAERVNQIEQAIGSETNTISDVTGKLNALESKAAEIDRLAADLDSLRQAQQAASATAPEGGISPDEANELRKRVAEVGQTLATLSSAAASGGSPDGNRIAQLAALSGKLTDLEGTLQTQLDTVRKGILEEVDARVAPAMEASAEARARTERLDRELAEIKTEAARLSQRAETLRANQERLDSAVAAAREEAAELSSTINGLKGDLGQQIAKAAKPEDVSQAVAPLAQRVDEIQTTLTGVIESEAARQESAEQILLSLQLSNLKRAIDRGASFATELGSVRELAEDRFDLSAMEPFKEDGVPTQGALLQEFQDLSFEVIRAANQPGSESWVDKLVSGAQSIVQVRRTGTANDLDPNSVEGIVARVEQHLSAGRLDAAAEAASALPAQSKQVAKPWLAKLDARRAVDRAIAQIEDDLKDSLTSNPAPAKKG